MAEKPQHGPRGGPYANDPRVTRDEGRPGYRLPSGAGDDWRVRPSRAGWLADCEHGQVAMDPTDTHNRRRRGFASADDAIGYVIGDPQGAEG